MNNEKETAFTPLKKMVNKFLSNGSNEVFTAERAWVETTYGKGCYRAIDKRIESKIKSIKAKIESRYECSSEQGYANCFASYYCIVNIEEDLQYHVDEIFAPFKENGFLIINLSEVVEELNGERVYLVSWKNAFRQSATVNQENEKNDTYSLREILNTDY